MIVKARVSACVTLIACVSVTVHVCSCDTMCVYV